MADLTLLHISDLHFGQSAREPSHRFVQPHVMSARLEDANCTLRGLGPQNRILLTRDVVKAGRFAE